jgi:hypothetical protein
MIINYRKNKINKSHIEIDKLVYVYQAKETMPSGFVQFPRLFRNNTEKLAVVWNMHEDDIRAKPKNRVKYFKDLGRTWFFCIKNGQ